MKAINKNYKDLLICQKDYEDLVKLYKQCGQCEEPSSYGKTSFIIPTIVISILIGFIAGVDHGP